MTDQPAAHRSGWRFPVERRHLLQEEERFRRMPAAPLLRAAGIAPGETVVDVGAGTGYWTAPAAELVGPSGRVIAVDVEPIMLAEIEAMARARSLTNVETVQSEELHIPLPDSVADLAILGFVLHEPPDAVAFMHEIARILKPGGRVLVIEWHKRETEKGPPVQHRLSPEEAGALLREAGMTVQPVESPDPDAYILLAVLSE